MQHSLPQQQQHSLPQQQQQHSHPLLSGMFNDLVKNEMVNMLNQMFAEMRCVDTPISLEELSRVNPPLYAQIQSRAEETAQAVLVHRMATQQSNYAQLPLTNNYPNSSSSTNNYPSNNSSTNNYPTTNNYPSSSLASSQQSFDYGSRQQSIQATPLIQQQQQQPLLHHPSTQHSYVHSSDLNPTFHNHLPATTSNQLSYQQSKKQRTIDYQQDDSSTMEYQGQQLQLLPAMAQRHRLIDTHPLEHVDGHLFPPGDSDRSGSLPDSTTLPQTSSSSSSHSSSQSSSSPDDSSLVNGFVCEVPVVLDVHRLHHLVAALDGTAAMKVTDHFRGAVLRVRARLQTYLKDLMVPPKLPSILFGSHSR